MQAKCGIQCEFNIRGGNIVICEWIIHWSELFAIENLHNLVRRPDIITLKILMIVADIIDAKKLLIKGDTYKSDNIHF